MSSSACICQLSSQNSAPCMTLSRTLYASFVHLSVVATVNTIASLQLELLSTVKTCASLHITVKTHIHYENIPLLAPTVKATVKTFGPLQTYPPTMIQLQIRDMR